MHVSVVFVSFCIYSGLFKTDKVVGTAQLKLEGLENHSDVREIIDVSVENMYTQMYTHMYTPGAGCKNDAYAQKPCLRLFTHTNWYL